MVLRHSLIVCVIVISFLRQAGGQVLHIDTFLQNNAIYLHQMDYLSFRYVVTPEMAILKFKPDGLFSQRYENNRLGQITQIDVTNPLKILVYYDQHQTLISLDNNLHETGSINLTQAGFGLVRALCMADDNFIWLWDEVSRTMTKIDGFGKKILEGQPNYTFELQEDTSPGLKQRGGLIYLYQTNQAIQVFNIFGNKVKTIGPLPNFTTLVAVGDKLIYQSNNDVYLYDHNDLFSEGQKLWTFTNDISKTSYEYNQQIIFALTPDGKLLSKKF